MQELFGEQSPAILFSSALHPAFNLIGTCSGCELMD
jgi:hypothetical protein